MKQSIRVLVILCVTALCAGPAFAVPITMNYQGYLTDSSGIPVNGTKNITFNLYTAINVIVPSWTETLAVAVEKGVYSVVLGANPVNPIDPSLFSGAPAIGIAVESDPEMTPRRELTSAAFSVRAASAETADTVADGAVTDAKIAGPIAAAKIAQGPGSTLDADTLDGKNAADLQNRVIGTCGPGSSITAVNSDGSVVCAPAGLTGTLAANYVPRSDGSGLADSSIFDNGKVGIGTATPVAKLDVVTTPIDTYGSWLPYDAYYNPCEHCADTCDGNPTAEFTCRGQLSCEDIRNSDGEFWEYRAVSCGQVQTAARFSGDVRVSGGTLIGNGSGLTNVNATSVTTQNQIVSTTPTGTAPMQVASTTQVPNLNADLLDGQHASDIISAASNADTVDSMHASDIISAASNADTVDSMHANEIIAAATDGIPPSWHQILPAAQRFVLVMNNGAVLDKETGLVWERSPVPTLRAWQPATGYCIDLELGSRKGWHLPTLEQLSTLLDTTRTSPSLPSGHPFINVQGGAYGYWSATTTPDTLNAWVVKFETGIVFHPSKTDAHYTWCVRGGQTLDAYN